MHRIDTEGSDKGKFVDRDNQLGTSGSLINSSWLNDFQNNYTNLIESEMSLDKNDTTQLFKVINSMIDKKINTLSLGVSSFNGRNGDVVPTKVDYQLDKVENLSRNEILDDIKFTGSTTCNTQTSFNDMIANIEFFRKNIINYKLVDIQIGSSVAFLKVKYKILDKFINIVCKTESNSIIEEKNIETEYYSEYLYFSFTKLKANTQYYIYINDEIISFFTTDKTSRNNTKILEAIEKHNIIEKRISMKKEIMKLHDDIINGRVEESKIDETKKYISDMIRLIKK